MYRKQCAPRAAFQEALKADGIVWQGFWNEGIYYEFTATDIATIKKASEELYGMFLEAGKFIISRQLYSQLEIPDYIIPTLEKAWRDEPPALNYGRFDLAYNAGTVKLFEFNCDTPTALLESSVGQWHWKETVFPKLGQANEIHEYLLEKWRDIANYLPRRDIHVMAMQDAVGEDVVTATYMAELATEAGLRPQFIAPQDIGWSEDLGFLDLGNNPITTLYKLYPWEWMLKDDFGKNVTTSNTIWLEPVWKMLWSNKAILPILWQLYPNHPLLLEADFKPIATEHVIKPMFGREGHGIRFSGDSVSSATDPLLGPLIYQKRFDVGDKEGHYPIIGSWIVDGGFAGLGIREGGPVTSNSSPFVPHVVLQ